MKRASRSFELHPVAPVNCEANLHIMLVLPARLKQRVRNLPQQVELRLRLNLRQFSVYLKGRLTTGFH